MKLTMAGIKDREAWEKAEFSCRDMMWKRFLKRRESHRAGYISESAIFSVSLSEELQMVFWKKGLWTGDSPVWRPLTMMWQIRFMLHMIIWIECDSARRWHQRLQSVRRSGRGGKSQSSNDKQWNRLKEIFAAPSLQLVSFTITEKGYALQKADGTWFPFVEADIKNGPAKATGAMAVLTAMLYERYQAGKYPLALVSMDNCSQNGARLRQSVLTMAEEWKKAGYVDDGFLAYVSDEKIIAFPWTMIDKITPRPSEQIAADLEALGVEDMQPVITAKKTYIAPFVNAEKPQYLVIEDSFPNGRPALEKGFGVYMADRKTVNLAERMKVTVCLNPVHSATGPLGVALDMSYLLTCSIQMRI